MLIQILCDAFGQTKSISFAPGLNIIQGINGNSIGKSTALKIIDYAFGGKYFAESNSDVIKNVGDHDICFAHQFGSTTSYFRRNASTPQIVQCCNDEKYNAIKEIPLEEFCDWLLNQYRLQGRFMSFRNAVSLYCRIWNKKNKEVNRPLYNHNAQPIHDSILTLVKLFNKYEAINDLEEHSKFLKKRKRVLSDAVTFNLLKIPSAKEYKSLLSEVSEINEKIEQIKVNISLAGNENYNAIESESNKLIDRRVQLQRQHGRMLRSLGRTQKNRKNVIQIEEYSFEPLKEFFPDVNINRLSEIQTFHNSIRTILLDELLQEENSLIQNIATIEKEIDANEAGIQRITELPTHANEALDVLQDLLQKKESLKSQIELYEDKKVDAKQQKETKGKLDDMLESITSEISSVINEKVVEYSKFITTSNRRAPVLALSPNQYTYGVEDNTGTGKAYTDLLLFDLAVLASTDLPILIHDSFLFNNIDDETKMSFLRIYSSFTEKQIFISLDTYMGNENDEINKLLFKSTRLFLSKSNTLYGKDWADESSALQ